MVLKVFFMGFLTVFAGREKAGILFHAVHEARFMDDESSCAGFPKFAAPSGLCPAEYVEASFAFGSGGKSGRHSSNVRNLPRVPW